ncbi:MAG: AMP-binding protein [Limisphaerales bacterium]
MFWEIEHLMEQNRGLYDGADGRFVSYPELLQKTVLWEEALRSKRKLLVALFCDNAIASIAAYLAALRSGHAVMLVHASMDRSLKHRICEIYSPEIVINFDEKPDLPDGYRTAAGTADNAALAFSRKPVSQNIHADTALLLSTSGTTGSPKMIRLSYGNLQSNALSIAQYLEITGTETAITSLPLSYSYGLSVVNSHLLAGANLICTNASLMTREFWGLFTGRQCTSFAGVPLSYAMLERLHLERMNLPSLRTMTQAGGRLAPEKIRLFSEMAERKGFRFFVMYGQTEATARISYVPWQRHSEKIGSVGVPIPGGHLHLILDGHRIIEPHVEGELVYSGPNVMLGYAETRDCLGKGDELHGSLHTGDLGYRDADGYYYITGRLKRFIKIYGLRLNLDEIEKMLESTVGRPVACAGEDESLRVLVESDSEEHVADAQRRIISLYKLHHSSVHVRRVKALPLNPSGKKDYSAIGCAIG